MKINQVLYQAVLELKEKGNASPRLDAEIILAHLLDVDRIFLLVNKDQELDKSMVEKYKELISRRGKGEPVAYITGHKEFMGLDFIVNKHVLVPRPDTEVLVEYIAEYIYTNQSGQRLNILDLGTGSGAIGLSIASMFPHSKVSLIDISRNALEVAKENAIQLDIANVQFILSDCFENVHEKYHIIVSNPPYIPAKDIDGLQIEVSIHEPRKALDGGLDGLDFYRRITIEAREHLLNGGLLAFEIGYNQADEVKKLFKENGYLDVLVLKDLGGHDRVVVGTFIFS